MAKLRRKLSASPQVVLGEYARALELAPASQKKTRHEALYFLHSARLKYLLASEASDTRILEAVEAYCFTGSSFDSGVSNLQKQDIRLPLSHTRRDKLICDACNGILESRELDEYFYKPPYAIFTALRALGADLQQQIQQLSKIFSSKYKAKTYWQMWRQFTERPGRFDDWRLKYTRWWIKLNEEACNRRNLSLCFAKARRDPVCRILSRSALLAFKRCVQKDVSKYWYALHLSKRRRLLAPFQDYVYLADTCLPGH